MCVGELLVMILYDVLFLTAHLNQNLHSINKIQVSGFSGDNYVLKL